jgi:hypothetical protein
MRDDGEASGGVTLLEMTSPKAQVGDTLVIARADGRADVRKLAREGWEVIRKSVNDQKSGWEIARNRLAPEGRVWFREESEPDSAMRLYNLK